MESQQYYFFNSYKNQGSFDLSQLDDLTNQKKLLIHTWIRKASEPYWKRLRNVPEILYKLRWEYIHNSDVQEPVTLDHLRSLVQQGKLSPLISVRPCIPSNWIKFSKIPLLSHSAEVSGENDVAQSGKAASVPAPWSRLSARAVDFWLVVIFISVVAVLLLDFIIPFVEQIVLNGVQKTNAISQSGPQPFYTSNVMMRGTILLLLYVSIKAFLISQFGTTPGKWLLNIRLSHLKRPKIPFWIAFKREICIFTLGEGFSFWPLELPCKIWSYIRLQKEGITIWDQQCQVLVHHRRVSFIRICICTFLIIVFPIVFFVLALAGSQHG